MWQLLPVAVGRMLLLLTAGGTAFILPILLFLLFTNQILLLLYFQLTAIFYLFSFFGVLVIFRAELADLSRAVALGQLVRRGRAIAIIIVVIIITCVLIVI